MKTVPSFTFAIAAIVVLSGLAVLFSSLAVPLYVYAQPATNQTYISIWDTRTPGSQALIIANSTQDAVQQLSDAMATSSPSSAASSEEELSAAAEKAVTGIMDAKEALNQGASAAGVEISPGGSICYVSEWFRICGSLG